MKRYFASILVTLFLCSSMQQIVFAEDINILLNNQKISSTQSPKLLNGTTFVPLRTVAEAMGCEVVWVAGTQTANIKNDTTIISMQIGNDKIAKKKRNGDGATSIVTCEQPPTMIDGNVYIPVRAMAESFGATVGWDGATQSVVIIYDTTLKYAGDVSITAYAGNGGKQRYDSTLDKMEFISPESIALAEDGSIYITDAGALRKIKNGSSETVVFEPEYITASIVRCFGNDVYILTNEFEDISKGMKYYGIVKLSNGQAEGIFLTEALYSKITDFTFAPDGTIYVLQNNVGTGENQIGRLEASSGNITYLQSVDNGVTSLAADEKGNLFLANSTKGAISYYDVAEHHLRLFAGVEGKTKFVDGPNPMFFEPRRVYYEGGYLYVLDFNTLRRVAMNNGKIALYAETLAGEISVESNPETKTGKASEAALAPSYLMEFVVQGDTVLLTDPKKGRVWKVQ